MTSHLAAVPAGDLLNWAWLNDQLMQIYVLLLIGAAIGIVFLFVKGKIAMAIFIIAIVMISFIPSGIASGGVASVKAIGVSIANAVHIGG